jgi:hypothetical protein
MVREPRGCRRALDRELPPERSAVPCRLLLDGCLLLVGGFLDPLRGVGIGRRKLLEPVTGHCAKRSNQTEDLGTCLPVLVLLARLFPGIALRLGCRCSRGGSVDLGQLRIGTGSLGFRRGRGVRSVDRVIDGAIGRGIVCRRAVFGAFRVVGRVVGVGLRSYRPGGMGFVWLQIGMNLAMRFGA